MRQSLSKSSRLFSVFSWKFWKSSSFLRLNISFLSGFISEFHLIFISKIRRLWSLFFTLFTPFFVLNFVSEYFLSSSIVNLVTNARNLLQTIKKKSKMLLSVLIAVFLFLVIFPSHKLRLLPLPSHSYSWALPMFYHS